MIVQNDEDEGSMADSAALADEVRDRLIATPEVILEDRDLMKALIAANETAMGTNIVDLRGIAMERLEARLDRLEDTHRSVIAAAYENLAGTNQIHRAILKMLEPAEFEAFLTNLGSEVSAILRVDAIRLVLESQHAGEEQAAVAKAGTGPVRDHTRFRRKLHDPGGAGSARAVVLRRTGEDATRVYGEQAAWIRSEAAMRLDFGQGRLPGLLVMGSEDAHQFRANQGTDLLGFFAGVFERMMRRWLG